MKVTLLVCIFLKYGHSILNDMQPQSKVMCYSSYLSFVNSVVMVKEYLEQTRIFPSKKINRKVIK